MRVGDTPGVTGAGGAQTPEQKISDARTLLKDLKKWINDNPSTFFLNKSVPDNIWAKRDQALKLLNEALPSYPPVTDKGEDLREAIRSVGLLSPNFGTFQQGGMGFDTRQLGRSIRDLDRILR